MLFEAICATLLLMSFCVQIAGSADPMVAFICNRPAMHSTDNGWVSDDSTGCLKDPTDILNYCQKVYPSLDIRNVVEGNKRATIGMWCDFGRTHCQQFSVLPFHCLVGPFQSDALLVPEHCAFHHIHEPKLCALIDSWKVKSEKSCLEKGMVQHSYGMLQPCGVSKFNGIEFVCCARNQTSATTKVSGGVKAVVAIEKTKAAVESSDDFTKYVSKPVIGRKWNEREYYMKAKNDMKKYHEDKVAKMMRDWATARQRVESLKEIDLKASEKLSKEITSRFQMMYKSEEAEKELERKQLEQLHDQRIQAQLSTQEQQIFEDFMTAVDDNNVQPVKVVRLLRRYIKALQKDRVHAVGLYTRLRETDPRSADPVRKQTMAQLESIERQLKKALLSLDRLSKQKNNIRRQIAMDLDNYYSLDESISILLLKPLDLEAEDAATSSTIRPSTKAALEDDDYEDDDDYDEDIDDDDDDDDDGRKKVIAKKSRERISHEDYIDDDVKDYDDDDDDDDDDEEDDEDEKTLDEEEDKKKKGKGLNGGKDVIASKPQTVPSSSSSPSSPPLSPMTIVRPFPGLSGDIEDDYLDDYIHIRRDNHPDNINRNKLHIQQPHIQKASVKRSGSFSSAVPLGIGVSGVTIFVVIVVGVVVMRRRARRSRPSAPAAVRGPEPAISSDDHHVSSMQMNGYENPTYKYLDGGNVK